MQDADFFLTQCGVPICDRFAEFMCQPAKKMKKMKESFPKTARNQPKWQKTPDFVKNYDQSPGFTKSVACQFAIDLRNSKVNLLKKDNKL